MRLIDADALERDGWKMSRTVRVDKDTMEIQTRKPTDFTLLPSAQQEKQHGRIFREIVVQYPLYSTCPEYKGKPYFSIKYTENGREFTGYGIYTPEVVSEFLKEYFMPSAMNDFDEPKSACSDCQEFDCYGCEHKEESK